jgi:tetratricopeptide (TPR) repeat protein
VCRADVDALAVLVDDHLVLRNDLDVESRFGMLETVREYALELLGDERAEAELALAAYLADLIDELRLSEGLEREWRPAVERLDPELDNARVGLAAAAAAGDAELEVRLAGGLWRYWWVRGSIGEGIERIERALAAGDGPPTAARARALYGAAGLTWSRGDLERAKELARSARSVAVAAGSEWYELGAHTVLGHVANAEGDRAGSRRHHERSLELKEQLGLEPLVEKLNLGEVAIDAGEYEAALALLTDILGSERRSDYPSTTAFAFLYVGRVHYELEQHEASRRAFEEALVCFEEMGFRSRMAFAIQGLAAAEVLESRFERAARLLGQARRLLDDAGTPEDRGDPRMLAGTKTRARAALGDEAYEAAYAAGVEAGFTNDRAER